MSSHEIDEFPDIEPETTFEVQLYIYDMTRGLAKSLSSVFLGKEIHGIWHTGIVAYGREYFYGATGIESCGPGETILGEADQILSLGKTELPYSLFLEYIFTLGESAFAPGTYDLFHHNCNNFSNEVSVFLTGRPIPQEIVDLPQEILTTPIGQTIKGYLDTLSVRPHGTGVNFGGINPASATPVSHNNNTTSSANSTNNIVNNIADRLSTNIISDTSQPATVDSTKKMDEESQPAGEMDTSNGPVESSKSVDRSESTEEVDEAALKAAAAKRTYKYKDPPVIFKEVDGIAAMKSLLELVNDLLNAEEAQLLKDWNDYITTDNGAWALGNEHIDLLSLLLSGGEGKFAPNVPLLAIQVLQAAALKDDFVLILHQDRKDHRIMSYINRIESLTLAEQEEIAKLLCNLCSQPSTFDWLMYISEWFEADGQPSSNSRVTTRAAVHTVLNDKLTTLQKVGVALIFNLALKELFDDIATELATAVLQFLHSELQEDQIFLCLTALQRFMNISYNDVPALVKMLGPDINKFKGTSERLDQIVDEIELKIQTALGSSTASM